MSYANFYDHMLNALKAWPGPWALDKEADLEDNEVVFKGTCMYLNANGNFQAGLACNAMPVLSVRNSSGSDVRQSPGNITGGKVAGIVVTGGYEVETTEYDDTQNYAPNTPLTAVNTGVTRGIVTVGTFYIDTVLGVVSDGVITGPYSKGLLRFWTCFIPSATCGSSPLIP
jgi:hypothetical protein